MTNDSMPELMAGSDAGTGDDASAALSKATDLLSLGTELSKLTVRDYTKHNSTRIRKGLLTPNPPSVSILRHGFRRWQQSELFKAQVGALLLRPRFSGIRKAFAVWMDGPQGQSGSPWKRGLARVGALAMGHGNDEILVEEFLQLIKSMSPATATVVDQLINLHTFKDM
jgi:hypothetical protein